MVGRIRGFLILFFIFTALGIGAAVVAFVDLDRTWFSVKTFAGTVFPDSDKKDAVQTTSWGDNLKTAQLFTEAAYEALKAGKAKPEDIYSLGQLYYKAKNDGNLDEHELDQIIELANETGIMDAVIDRALEPVEDVGQTPQTGTDSNPEEEMKALMTEFEQVGEDGRLNPGELVYILNKARDNGLQNRLAAMMPPDYDQTRTRVAARNLAIAVATGKTSMDDANTLVQMFIRAQTDGRLDRQELDQITQSAEMFVR